MGAPVDNAERQQQRPRGLIGGAVVLPFKLLGILLFLLFVSILLEYLGLAFFWSEQGWRHSQAMFEAELAWLNANFKESLILEEPGQTMAWLLGQLYERLFVKSGFAEFAQHRIRGQQGRFLGGLSQLYVLIEDYVLAALYTALTFVVRLLVLVLAIFTGAVDGLVRRDLRKFGAGRESSFVYHRAKQTLVPLPVAPWLIYLALPVSLNPALVLLPCAAMLGLAITAATFKKYL